MTLIFNKNELSQKAWYLSVHQITAALSIIAYGLPPDTLDEYRDLSETTAWDSLMQLCEAVSKTLSEMYPRSPTEADILPILRENEERGLPGLLGSID